MARFFPHIEPDVSPPTLTAMLQGTRDTILRISNGLGLSPVVRDGRWRRGRLLILAYHGIALEDEHVWHPGLYVSPKVFRERLSYLKRGGYQVLPLGEAFRLLRSGRLPPRAVAITFDDGFFDFYKHALPALREFGFPATVYLSTYYCRYQKPVFDLACSYVLWKAGARPKPTVEDLRAEAQRRGLSASAKNELLVETALRLGVDYDHILRERLLHLMTPDEVSTLAADNVTVELHTHRHRTPRNRDAFLKEIADNRISIQAMTGSATPPVHFCYPSGVHKPEFLPWLYEAGIASATTCALGLASRRSHPLLLPRLLDCSTITPTQFEGWLTGIGTFLPRRPTFAYA